MNRFAEHASEVALLRDLAARLEAELQAVLTSSSWRLTRPMRSVARTLRALLRLWPRPSARPTAPPEPARPAEPVRHITFDSITPEHALPAAGKPVPETDLVMTLAPVAATTPDRLLVASSADMPPACTEPGDSAERYRLLLLVGSENPDDVAGLRHFLRFAWPIIRRAAPAAELAIAGEVGAAMGKAGTGVRLLAGPPDRAYDEASIVLSPAIASGFRLEVAQALRHGLPVVCWPGALAGLPGELHPFCHAAANWVMFARHTLRLLVAANDGGAALRAAAERAIMPDRVAEVDATLAPPPSRDDPLL